MTLDYISADIFSDTFINEHSNKYDTVIIQDCSFTLGFLNSDLKDNGIEKIKDRVYKLTRLLRTTDSILYINARKIR